MNKIGKFSNPCASGMEGHRSSSDEAPGVVHNGRLGKTKSNALLDGLRTSRQTALSLVKDSSPQTPSAKSTPSLLVHAAGSRQLTFEQAPDGKARITMKYPPIEHLVLSGGGAKGAAYPGAVLALENAGVMSDIKRISGSSAGAITAAMLAAGVSGEEFRELANGLDFLDLTRQRVGPLRFQAIRHANEDILRDSFESVGKKIGILRNMGSNIVLLSNMRTEAPALEELIRDETRKSVLRHVATHEIGGEHKSRVNEICARLKHGGEVTFGDLRNLSQCIPAIKEFRCTGTMMEDGRPQLMVFGADTTPDLGIARAARISGSFPFVFAQPKETTPFGTAHYQDGGVMLNTPAAEILQPGPVSRTLPHPDSLVLTFTPVSENESHPRQGIAGALKDWLVGAPVGAQHALQMHGLRNFREDVVEVPLKNERGDFSGTVSGTLNFGMSRNDKLALQRDLKNQVERHLTTRDNKRISIEFPSTKEAMLALHETEFNALQVAHPILTSELHAFRAEARSAIDGLSVTVRALDNVTPDMLRNLVRPLDQLCCGDQSKIEFMARQLLDPAKPEALARIQDTLRHTTINSPVLQALNILSEKQDVANAAHNAVRDIIYPARFKLWQSANNHALLDLVEKRLTSASTRKEYNSALETLARNYEGRMSLLSKPLSSSTVELAEAYQIREN
ncbi:patatin-like phospholipase family protein [Burkholderia ubonensis]|uniref:patatin-like phospholipase family protein n=1 Tax=Burkholderia ubonensis TaxID=101571 RepID=UPI000A52C2F2|nr:patatin-like phospholipase family protein [Burkholderia ubonensis]